MSAVVEVYIYVDKTTVPLSNTSAISLHRKAGRLLSLIIWPNGSDDSNKVKRL